ncbi:PRMT5-domain-containing protein [Ceraceosorus guamensis]|uniref:PRMT5-domain-containing protein n=1 Tax=Ceraceosorus guamensis TaxID=1522189 RepID=A0A316VR56_9BASI|nr:PRMT5-domain-containing protein [Ceraceosorus guamensis]PWN40076.1 PRMT5-domain-containing protein [Ceraceosorus guamensis]
MMSAPAPVGVESGPPLPVGQFVDFNSHGPQPVKAFPYASLAAIESQSRRGPPSASGSTSGRATPGGLEPLPEASHINALSEASGPSPAGLPGPKGSTSATSRPHGKAASSRLEGLNADIDAALAGLTQVQRLRAVLRSEGYDKIVVPLTNEKWKDRWERMCLAPATPVMNGHMAADGPAPAHDSPGASAWDQPKHAMSNPGAMGESWEILTREQGMKRSTSRPHVALPDDSPRRGGTAPEGAPKSGGGSGPAATFKRKLKSPIMSGHGSGGSSKSPPSEASAPSTAFAFSSETEEQARMREAEDWRRAPAFRRNEVNIAKIDETDGLVAVISPWLELDSPDEGVRLDSEIALRQEVAYAAFLGIPQVVLPAPSSSPSHVPFLPFYARAISGLMSSGGTETAPAGSWMQLSLRLPVSSVHAARIWLNKQGGAKSSKSTESLDSGFTSGTERDRSAAVRGDHDWAWGVWELMRQITGYPTRLSVALDLGVPLPSAASLSHWAAEPVGLVLMPAGSFLANAKGFPVLSKAAQSLCRSLMRRKPLFVLSGIQEPPPRHTRGTPSGYLQYLRHIERSAPAESAVDTFARGYADWLQAPLQPLMDNLESQTYEVFERDPIKYQLYEEAVAQALADRSVMGVISVWVCGAGRGPLVSRVLAAATKARRNVKVIALEKNANALVTLQERIVNEWGDKVELRFGDMRTMPAPSDVRQRADIVVSELLGSFGDNELSPECLDGAMRFLKPDGVSIPSSYTPFLTPLSSAKLHSEVLNVGGSTGNAPSSGSLTERLTKASETPYVVLFQAVQLLAAHGGRGNWEQVQHAWTFEHAPLESTPTVRGHDGLPITNQHNVRSTTHTFHIPEAGTCHGLAGYFEAHLYGNVFCSIHPDPERTSTDMLSWFPIFFPFKEPLYLPAKSELDVSMWRLTSDRKVWYEWCAQAYLSGAALAIQTEAEVRPSARRQASIPGLRTVSAASNDSHDAGANGAFVNAPNTPGMPSVLLPSASDEVHPHSGAAAAMGRPKSVAGNHVATSNIVIPQRIYIAGTALHNPGGRSSFVGM